MENEKGQVAPEYEVLETLTKIMRREVTEDCVVKLKGDDKAEYAETVSVRPKLADVIRAAELLGKSYGMFSERIEGSIALPLIICGEDELE